MRAHLLAAGCRQWRVGGSGQDVLEVGPRAVVKEGEPGGPCGGPRHGSGRIAQRAQRGERLFAYSGGLVHEPVRRSSELVLWDVVGMVNGRDAHELVGPAGAHWPPAL